MTSLVDIETRAKKYAEAREHLAGIVAALNDGIEALKRDHMKRLKKAVADAAERHDALKALIEDAPELFVKPRTVVFHGIKLGYQKGKGKIEWDDADQVVRLIKKHFPEQADVLVATTERPAKDALAQLTAAELKKLGISVTDGGDAVFIKPADSAVDKMVDALLKDATEEVAA
ncbi:MAG: host-nuclease inhibitor Gam family protein [Pseudomonadota bacterium]